MKTIWAAIGIIILLAIIFFIYKQGQKSANPSALNTFISGINPSKNTEVVERVVTQPVIQPVFITGYTDCNSQTYQDNVYNLRDVYLQKRVIWSNGIKTSDPMTIQYREDMNVAYNSYYQEAIKCNLLNK